MRLLEKYHWSARIGLWIGASIGAAGFYFMRDTFDGAMTLILSGLAVYLGIPRAAAWWLWRDACRRFDRAFRDDNAGAMRGVVDEMRETWTKGKFGGYEAVVLMCEERWADAHEKLSAIDRNLLDDGSCAPLLNNLAWCELEMGRAEEAIALVEEALPLAASALRPYCSGTLGAALVVAGRSAEGIRHLEEALRSDGTRAATAARLFYLGEGLRALGRRDEAWAAYRLAADVRTPSSYPRRADQQLAALSTAPHR